MEFDLEKEELKRKKLLQQYLKDKNIVVNIQNIKSTASWKPGELQIGPRIYQVDLLSQVIYGAPWYKSHEYKDINGYRISESYHFYNGIDSWSLSIACEQEYTWKHRTTKYKNMTDNQIRYIAETYICEYIKNKPNGKANIDILRKTICYELKQRFQKIFVAEKPKHLR